MSVFMPKANVFLGEPDAGASSPLMSANLSIANGFAKVFAKLRFAGPFSQSVLNDFAGLAVAALSDWLLTVRIATRRAPAPAAMKNPALRGI